MQSYILSKDKPNKEKAKAELKRHTRKSAINLNENN